MLAAKDPVLFAKENTRAGMGIQDYFIREYLPWSQTNKSKHGYERDQTICKFLVEWLEEQGLQALPEIQQVHMEKYKTHRKERSTTENTNRHFHTIRHAFNMDVDWGYIDHSPCSKVKQLPPEPDPPPRFFSQEEIEAILWAAQGISQGFYRAVHILASTGARRNEWKELRWRDIDFQREVVKLKTLKKSNKYVTRVVPLTESLVQILRGAKERKESICDTLNLRRRLKRVLKKLNIPGATTHTLRHTFASHLVQQGVSLYVVAELLGHSNVMVTRKYAHLCPETLHSAVDKLPWCLGA